MAFVEYKQPLNEQGEAFEEASFRRHSPRLKPHRTFTRVRWFFAGCVAAAVAFVCIVVWAWNTISAYLEV